MTEGSFMKEIGDLVYLLGGIFILWGVLELVFKRDINLVKTWFKIVAGFAIFLGSFVLGRL